MSANNQMFLTVAEFAAIVAAIKAGGRPELVFEFGWDVVTQIDESGYPTSTGGVRWSFGEPIPAPTTKWDRVLAVSRPSFVAVDNSGWGKFPAANIAEVILREDYEKGVRVGKLVLCEYERNGDAQCWACGEPFGGFPCPWCGAS